MNYAIAKKKLYEEVMDQILKLVTNGGYKVGDRLPSLQELSDMFGVGKPTLREALSVLAATGILEIRHGSGIFVRKLFDDHVYDAAAQIGKIEGESLIYWLEYRRAIEVEAAALAAIRRNEFDIRSMEEAHKGLEADALLGKTETKWDFLFHQRIALATHNPIFTKSVATTYDLFHHYFELSLKQTLAIPSRREIVTQEHWDILAAIKKGEPPAAQKAMLRHIDNIAKKVKLLSDL